MVSVSDLVDWVETARKRGQEGTRQRGWRRTENELGNSRTECHRSHLSSGGVAQRPKREMKMKNSVARIAKNHDLGLCRGRLFYCSHRDGKCGVELKTLGVRRWEPGSSGLAAGPSTADGRWAIFPLPPPSARAKTAKLRRGVGAFFPDQTPGCVPQHTPASSAGDRSQEEKILYPVCGEVEDR